MKRGEGPLFEYACHEGNRGMVNILSFARAEEQGVARVAALIERSRVLFPSTNLRC